MLKVHKDIIIANLDVLVGRTDVQALANELLRRNVFNERMIKRILNPSRDARHQKTDLYVEILRRGPEAFAQLLGALETTNHSDLAELLADMDTRSAAPIHRSPSLDSVSSSRSPYSSDANESDGPCLSTPRDAFGGNSAERPNSFPVSFPPNPGNSKTSKTSDIADFHPTNVQDRKQKVFASPVYGIDDLVLDVRLNCDLAPEDRIIYSSQKNLPVNVIHAKNWQIRGREKPPMYKMDSNPRGFALIVNNINFDNSHDFPERLGADNDEIRLEKLKKQLHFEVEVHRNKTKMEMEEIVRRFSRKPELNNVDCIWVTFMSHGQEGNSVEDSEVIGVDGVGYSTESIVSMFYNDVNKALINKPKFFTFQACRGDLTDPGVLLGIFQNRITTDGKKVPQRMVKVKVRTQSDIFIAYPSPPGIMANRDKITGTWFIQAIVDVFSEFACTLHLEELLKMVDERIKKTNNLAPDNFQAVTTKSIGWNKDLYFNPGLSRDKATGKTIYINPQVGDSQDQTEGMDVVDATSSNSDKSRNGASSYGGLKDDDKYDDRTPNGTSPYKKEKDDKHEDSDHGYGCFDFSSCRTS